MHLPIDPDSVKGFLHPDEGQCLYQLALEASALGPCLEVGSYCGKSTLYLGTGARDGNGLLYALDHHRGSEEHQLGEEYHDPDLYDAQVQKMDSLPTFRRTLALAQLESAVVPVVASSVRTLLATTGTTADSSCASASVRRNVGNESIFCTCAS